MALRNIFLNADFIKGLTDSEYEALFLLVRILSELRLRQKSLYTALESGKFRNFEIIELNSSLLATYTEGAKAYVRIVSEPIFGLLGRDYDDFTRNLRNIYQRKKSDSPIEYQVLSFIRDTTTFHFHGGYLANNRSADGERIAFMGLADVDGDGSVYLTNTIPHILEEIQKISGKDLSESTIADYFRELNESLVYPFGDYINKLVHEVIDRNIVMY